MIPTNAAPITFYIRESADWLPHALARERIEESRLSQALECRGAQGARLARESVALVSPTILDASSAFIAAVHPACFVWELATAGLPLRGRLRSALGER